MENKHGGHRERLRNKFISSPESLEDHELLELLLFYVITPTRPRTISYHASVL